MIGDLTAEQLKSMHPNQNIFQFGNITISSQFDSGNLARAEEAEDPFSVAKNFFLFTIILYSITSGYLQIQCPTSRTVATGKYKEYRNYAYLSH